MEFSHFFTGYSLNAVDAKGRVSLPADFRAIVEKRVAPEGATAKDRQVYIGEHERLRCLIGYDATYAAFMSGVFDQRMAMIEGADPLREGEALGADDYGSAAPVSYDEPGRMILPITRKLVGIDSQAFFFGMRRSFQIWEPQAFLDSDVDAPRTKRVLALLLKEAEEKKAEEKKAGKE